jgi:MoaA/NifB/PqqE/SkfB family radical SAM enzyme
MFFPASYLSRVWMGSKVSTKLLPSHIRPLSAHVKLTENCQARCISCDYWKSRWQDAIDTDHAVELVNQIGAVGIRSLRLTGGEPLLRKDLFHILHTANTSLFKRITLQTNGLLIKKLHNEINDSPITNISVSIDGLKQTNDVIRGIRGYFDLALEGIQLLRDKLVALSVTLNRMSAEELRKLADVAHGAGAAVEFNILSRSLYFLQDADIASLWPERSDVAEIEKFLRDVLKRPAYEVDYVTRYYKNEGVVEPPCVLGFLQVFVISNGDVLTGCYPLKPVGNILRDDLATILGSEAYLRQSVAMIRRECPGCTCGIESSLAMKHSASSAFFELSRLKQRLNGGRKVVPIGLAQAEDSSRP